MEVGISSIIVLLYISLGRQTAQTTLVSQSPSKAGIWEVRENQLSQIVLKKTHFCFYGQLVNDDTVWELFVTYNLDSVAYLERIFY